MAKLIPVQLYCISLKGGTYSNGDRFIIMYLNEDPYARTGAMKVISDNTDMFQDILDATIRQDLNIDFPKDKKKRKLVFLNRAISVGKGIIFDDSNVPIVIHVKKLSDGTEKRVPLTSVSGVALFDLGESVREIVEIEMIRRCNNHQEFLPVKGQDYSRYL